jgi:NADPH:quinone reductase-like Zn-dependent oxidoreductase
LQTRAGDFGKAALEATGGRGVNVAINTVGGSVFAECVRSLAFEGRLAIVGYVDGVLKAEIDLDALHAKRLKVFGVSNKLRNAEQRAGSVRGFVADILPGDRRRPHPPLGRAGVPFGELPRAKEAMESNRHTGKIVLVMP